MPTSTPTVEPVTFTVPFVLKDAKPRTSHFHEVKADGGKTYAGAILVLANTIVEALGTDAKDLTITITAGKAEPTVLLPEPVAAPITPAPAPEPTKAEGESVQAEAEAAAKADGVVKPEGDDDKAKADEPKAKDKAADKK